jgi:hypothetical protein
MAAWFSNAPPHAVYDTLYHLVWSGIVNLLHVNMSIRHACA